MKIFAAIFCVALLAACGCGGGGATTPTPTPTPTPANIAPVANAGVAQSVVIGSLVAIDGSASSDANGDALTYAWTLISKPAGSSAALLAATSVKPTLVVDVAGTYVAALTVSDGKLNSAAVTVSITAAGLSLPSRALNASQLAVIVAAGDPVSEAIASYYQSARGVPAANIIRVTLSTGVDTISATDFASLKAQIDATLPAGDGYLLRTSDVNRSVRYTDY